MIFNNLNEVKDFYRQYRDLEDGEYDYHKNGFYHSEIDDYLENYLEFGQYILFKHIKDGNKISRPILGIFLGYNIWDQALVIEFVEKRKNYMDIHDVITNKDKNYTMIASSLDIQTEQIQFWTDDIILMGFWNYKPNWKEMKSSLINKLPSKLKRNYILNGMINDKERFFKNS